MQTQLDRRDSKGSRVSLDVLVSFSDGNANEYSWEADAVDIGRGGMALRAPMVPDVGTTLQCKFECPPDGSEVLADGEVVWAQTTGARMGEFGVRFKNLEGQTRDAVDRIVGRSGVDREPARLLVDGLQTPIAVRMTHRAQDLITLEQELSFLRLGRGVELMLEGQPARRGRLELVELRMDAHTPKLVMAVVFDDEFSILHPTERTADVESSTTGSAAGRAAALMTQKNPSNADATAHDVDAPDFLGGEDDVDETERQMPGARDQMFAVDTHDFIAEDVGEDETQLAASTEAFENEITRRAVRSTRSARIPPRANAKLVSAEAAERIAGQLKRLLVFCFATVKRAVGRFSAALSKGAEVARAQAPLARLTRRDANTSPKRRVTSLPPQLRDAQAHEAAVVEERRVRGRHVVVAIAACAVVIGGLIALRARLRGTPETSPTVAAPEGETSFEAPRPVVFPAGPSPLPVTATPTVEPVESPAARVKRAANTIPSALPEPSYAAGPVPTPTYPALPSTTVPSATAARTEPSTPAPGRDGLGIPSTSPYAQRPSATTAAAPRPAAPTVVANPIPAPARGLSSAFGAPTVERPKSFTLRMSQRVQGLRGASDARGFTVDVVGALSLDRASPIATAHRGVERAAITNRGDHSELTVRFKDGYRPKYRVVARGAAIEILLGQ